MPIAEETFYFFLFAFGCFFVPFVAAKWGEARLTWRNMELTELFNAAGVEDMEC